MMSFAERVARMQDAVFQTLGEDADWAGFPDPVRVRYREFDAVEGFGGSQVLVADRVIMVRRSEVPSPVDGDLVVLVASGRRFRLTGDPKIDRKGHWVCVVAEE